MKKWEYKPQKNISTEEMNELGLQGWELVSTNVVLHPNNSNDVNVYYFYKKEIQ